MNPRHEILKLVANAVLETVRECPDGAAEGPMYGAFMEHGMNLQTFQAIVEALIATGKIRREGYLLFAKDPTP